MKLQTNALNRLNYLLGETEALYHELAFQMGLSDSAMRILYALCDNGESCLLRQLCRCSGLSKQTVNSALRKLEQQGVLYLEAVDARAKQVRLTPKGRELARHTVVPVMEMEKAVFAGWDPRAVQDYLRYTEQFLQDMRQQMAARKAQR